MLTIQGPRSRAHSLSGLTTVSSLSERGLPLSHFAREIDIGYARVDATRVTYLGELGWELYIPTEHAMEVYGRLVDTGSRLTA